MDSRLRSWLEVDRGVEFAAFPFLHEVIEQISGSMVEVTEDELDRLALAIERVLPKDVRATIAETRRIARFEHAQSTKGSCGGARYLQRERYERTSVLKSAPVTALSHDSGLPRSLAPYGPKSDVARAVSLSRETKSTCAESHTIRRRLQTPSWCSVEATARSATSLARKCK